ncbi:hypothetical protein B0F90DRAFT_1737521 [Multifurca ochricompacta]|uniref:Uncharacterized protein n=1 Tax=Multifurca ochricompacta TaxID=376703 RepID=A0AAD4QKR9_9AGAM|nr:hypothetical protein B0F90DRAFT_1737521 [Multifurca ochricompacta]
MQMLGCLEKWITIAFLIAVKFSPLLGPLNRWIIMQLAPIWILLGRRKLLNGQGGKNDGLDRSGDLIAIACRIDGRVRR